MEEEMVMVMMNDDTSPRWKLYENPFYINTPHKSSTTNGNPFKRRMDWELHLERNHILELQTQLRYERKARKKVESLAKRLLKELNEERKQREAMEGVCHELATHISSHQPHKEIQEERNMLRLAPALREERLQMKLAEVKTVFEHMLSQLQSETTTTFPGGGRYGRRRD
ncbi:protein BRANCHLESS TRICHOME-like [Cucurbita maxima]|uniref:Protein BRANCHLESS TRICHOME-like n=1 Tax=Cucurbita maxima TaxID=3661 RepID=A0A6J1K999_CUCMA|nr:protein BRANCHLESS TRICHOME-like [Cucurbita maxima]